MSLSPSLPDSPDLEFEKKQAKALLRACRAGDAAALTRMRPHLPQLGDAPTLSDTQFVIARERGFESWPRLKAHIKAAQPLAKQAARFLAVIRDRKLSAAKRLLAQHPTIAQSSIHAAAAAADVDAVAAFLASDRALAVAPDTDGPWPPLLYACWSGVHTLGPQLAAASLGVVELLLDHGADPNTSTLFDAGDAESRLSALYFACESNNVAAVRLLLARGAQPDDGESVYHAAQRNHRECLDSLLDHGANLSGRHAHWGNTPLYFLAGHDNDEEGQAAWFKGMQWLLGHGADPNVTSGPLEETPLHAIVKSSRAMAATTALVKGGTDLNRARADGRTPYALALRAGNDAAVQLLRDHGAATGVASSIDELLGACFREDATKARAIAQAHPTWRANLSAEDRGMLAHAAAEGRSDAVRLMVELGFDLAWEGVDGSTALHQAAWRGRPDLVRLLLDLGAPVNMHDSVFGTTPIGWAAHGSSHCRSADDDYCAVVELLLAAGADYAASINKWGEPPQNMASKRVKALLLTREFGRT